MKAKKFATQIDPDVLKDLRAFAKKTDRSISSVVSDAVKEYISKAQIRPAFRSAMDEVLEDHSELLTRLAK
ncbi:MAG TPA: hypothetical protein DCL41_08370 [Bdellovibrionales bacterium]|nr:hypothetical protein [Pseudobdellovibrionaceae bacterium]HAG91871.1 hypothetical protein [Bdellovibrionales bacterium]